MDASVPSSVAPEEDMTTKRKQLWWSVLGMEVAPKRRPRLPAIAVQFLLGIVGLALITFVCFLVGFGLARTAFAYVILIALVSLLGSFSTSVVLSIIAVACLNYFFVPPLFEFRVDDPEDIVRMAAFLTTSLVVTALTTKRKRAEEGLAESRARLEEAQRLAHAGWWERDLMTDQVTVSDEVSRILGVRPVTRWLNLIHPEDRSRVAEAAAAAIRPGGPRYDVEYRVVRPDGILRVVHSQGDVTWDDSGRPLRQFGVLQDITELRHAEQELRASEARLRTFVDHATDAFFLLDEDWTLLDVNRQACDALGYSREELIGKHKSDFDVGLDDASIQRLKQRMLAGEPITFETRHRRKDGTSFPVEARIGQFEQDGRRFLCLVRDITERKRAEDELRASEARFRTFVDHAMDGFFLLDEHQAILDVNRQACESLGYSREEMIGMHPRDFDAGLDDASIARIGERVKAGETVTFESLHRRKGGIVFPVEVRACQFQQGTHRFRLSLARDVTERKRAEVGLRESETKLQNAQRIAHVGWWERDFTTSRVSLSDEVCRIFGLDPVDLPEWHARWLQLIHPEDRPRAAEAAAAALLPGGPRYDVEYRVVRADGGERIVRSQGDVTWDESGKALRQFGVLQDITELRQAEKELRASEEALRRSEAYLAEAQRLSHTGTLAFNATAPAYWSEESYRIWGLDPLQGLPSRETVLQRIHPDDRQSVNVETEEALRQKRDFTLEFRIVLPDGTVKYIESTGRPLLSANGELVEMVATHVDATERKRAQEEHERLRALEADLAHMNRLSIMGELTASLAHEILHPIASARNNARAAMRFLDMSPPNMAKVREALACIVRDADRGKDIVDRIRAQIKKAPPRNARFDINQAIGEVIEMVRAPIEKNRVSVRTHLAAGLPSVWGDRVQLQQVVLNLVLNAIEAMGSVEERARMLSIRTEQRGPEGILVAVHDSGPGVDPEHLQRVFDPFYTTKNSGLGMGLSICRSIIDAHGGRLWADTNEPRGAVFEFTLPPAHEDS
jgi:PAS domain S-box-containing protein